MKTYAKIERLHELRRMRERLGMGRLQLAQQVSRTCQEDLGKAEKTLVSRQNERRENVIRAMRDAEDIRDATARFIGIAVTLNSHDEYVNAARMELQDTNEKLKAARVAVRSSKFDVSRLTRDRLKFSELEKRSLNKADRIAEIAEEDEMSELFVSKSPESF